jgi:PAS domain S-box-containing protein
MQKNPSREELSRRIQELEEAMRETGERYRLLAENVSDVIFTRDMNLRFTYISPSVEKLTGYSVEEAMALTMAESYTPRSIELVMEAFSEELSTEKEEQNDPSRVRTMEMEGYRKDGSTIWTEARMSFLRDSSGHPVGILGVSRDITERKQAERAMIISEERYRSLVEDMPVLVCRFLPDGTLTFVNNSLCDYFGRKRETLIGQKFFQFIPEEEHQEVMDRFASLTRENPVVTYEHQLIRSDGTRRWQHRIDRALFDEAGDLKEYQCQGLDVTERKRVEQALRQSEERLRTLSMELIKAQEKERRRISGELHDELGQSLAILKHRVRSIGKSLSKQRQTETDIVAAVELVDQVIEKVRKLSRDLNPSLLDDLGFCPALRHLAENLMEECRIPTSLDISDIDAFVSKEAAINIYRICQEALTNIVKHAGANHVSIRMTKENERLSLFIADDGKGFDPHEVETRARTQRGLGLTVMQERAHLIGGTLEIRGHPKGGGTKISLIIPLQSGGH